MAKATSDKLLVLAGISYLLCMIGRAKIAGDNNER